MRILATTPSLSEAIGEVIASSPKERLLELFANASPTTANGRYLHWHDMQYRTPPAGLSRKEWWAATLFGRSSLMRPLKLLAKDGQHFNFATPNNVLIHLHHIDREAAGHVQASIASPSPGDPTRYMMKSFFEEAITSSQLEGASTTRKEAAAMLNTGRKPRNHGETMIFNNYRAMQLVRAIKNEHFTPERILELHRVLTEDTLSDPADAGRLRLSNDIHVVDQRDESIVHIPPTYTELPERLIRLCDFGNADENLLPFVHPVLRAILMHFMIGYDHPFADGNGRTARALFYWSMARSGYWLMEYASISHILKRAPVQYMRAYLRTETDNNDTTYFLLHQLTTIRRAIDTLHDYLDNKTRERNETEKLLAASPNLRARFNHRQIALINHALRTTGEGYRIDIHQHSHRIAYQTAHSDLMSLAKQGVLERAQQGKAYVFYSPVDLRERLSALAKS